MPIRKRKPTSPGRRFQTSSDFSEVTKDRPEKRLTKPKPKSGGRNSYGRMTSRHRGGGHKQRYRVVDFKRNKDGVPATVAGIEYDPNRNCRIALLHFHDGEKRYILAPDGVRVGDKLQNGQGSEIRAGNALPIPPLPSSRAAGEAIQSFNRCAAGLLHFVRNDGEGTSAGRALPEARIDSRRTSVIASRRRSDPDWTSRPGSPS